MGDNNHNTKSEGDEVTPLTVSSYFDNTHKTYVRLVGGEDDPASLVPVQERITKTIRDLEDLTRQVSVLGILSDNESWKEMNPTELKFILLPFMIGNLWQLSRADSRENVCHVSQVYFRDYMRRCYNYEIISKLPAEARSPSSKEDDESEEKGAAKKTTRNMNSDDIRAMKIQRFKEAKMLDEKIAPHLKLYLGGESLDDEDLQTFVVSLLKRSVIDAEDQLRSIAEELELIKYAERMKIGSTKPNEAGPSTSASHSNHHHHSNSSEKHRPKKPPQIFILTKTEVEKQVFGAGYPAVPVMTVEELYEQRRKTGQWGPHASSNLPPPTETDDDRDAQKELLEEIDDEEMLARQRQMDEYKDDHRRGWGNRYNRS